MKEDLTRKEAQIHSMVTDKLDEDHPLAYEEVFCDICDNMVHCFNNECMRTWIEIESGNFCLDCFCENPGKVIGYGFWLQNGNPKVKRLSNDLSGITHDSIDEDSEEVNDTKKQAEDFYKDASRYLTKEPMRHLS